MMTAWPCPAVGGVMGGLVAALRYHWMSDNQVMVGHFQLEQKKRGKQEMMVLLRMLGGQIVSKFVKLVVLVLVLLCVPVVVQLITFAKDFDPQSVLVESIKKVQESCQ